MIPESGIIFMGDIKTKSAGSLASFLPHSTWEPVCRLGCGMSELKRWSVSFVFPTEGGEGMFCRHMTGFFQSFSLGHNKESLQALKTDKLDLWIYWVIFSAFLPQELGRHYLQGLLRAS